MSLRLGVASWKRGTACTRQWWMSRGESLVRRATRRWRRSPRHNNHGTHDDAGELHDRGRTPALCAALCASTPGVKDLRPQCGRSALLDSLHSSLRSQLRGAGGSGWQDKSDGPTASPPRFSSLPRPSRVAVAADGRCGRALLTRCRGLRDFRVLRPEDFHFRSHERTSLTGTSDRGLEPIIAGASRARFFSTRGLRACRGGAPVRGAPPQLSCSIRSHTQSAA